MKKLLTFSAVVVFSGVLVSHIDATIVIFTDNAEILDAPTVTDANLLDERDFIRDITKPLLSADPPIRNEYTDTLHTLPSNTALSTYSAAEINELTFKDGGQIENNSLTDVPALLFCEYWFHKKQSVNLVYVPDIGNIILLTEFGAMPDGSTLQDSDPAGHEFFFDEYFLIGNELLDVVYGPDSDIILLTTPGAMLGGSRFGYRRLSEYNPKADTAALLFDEYLSGSNILLDAAYVPDNNDIILLKAPAMLLERMTFKGSILPEYNPTTDTVPLFFDEHLFAGDKSLNAVYVHDSGNTIMSTTPGAVPGSLTFESPKAIEHNLTANVPAFYFQESVFADIEALHAAEDNLVAPEPATIAILGLGSLFRLRNRKGKAYRNDS